MVLRRLAFAIAIFLATAAAAWYLTPRTQPAPGPVPAPGPAVPAPPRRVIGFVDRAARAGILAPNTCGDPEKRYIIDENGAGAAFLDYDNDGLLDVFLVNGSTLEGLAGGRHPGNTLYRNRGDGTFEDVTGAAGMRGNAWGVGVAAADYDNDGDTDLFLANFGPNALWRNEGDGRYTDVTDTAGLAGAPEDWSSSAVWLDHDLDGDLDLYVVNYVRFDPGNLAAFDWNNCDKWRGLVRAACGPKGLQGQQDRLHENLGDGRFREVSEEAGIRVPIPLYGLAVTAGDVDGDGDPDIYVANDATPNLLFRNEGGGRYTEVGLAAGVALGGDGTPQAGMGVDMGDYDNDGRLDIVVTNFDGEPDTLYRNLGDGRYADVSAQVGLAGPTRPVLGFGTGFLDFDNDGRLDLFVANGHIFPGVDDIPGEAGTYAEANQLFRNDGRGRFQDQSLVLGPGLLQERVSRGATFGDIDDDGDMDILVVNQDDLPSLLENRGGNGRAWLRLTLVGTRSNRDAIGARVRVIAAGLAQVREVQPGGSYASSRDRRLHLGLGNAERADRIEVRWPSGITQTFENVPGRRGWVITEGEEIRPEPPPRRGALPAGRGPAPPPPRRP